MLKTKISNSLKQIIEESVPIEIFIPENEKFGHYSTNLALRLAKSQGKNPMEIANGINEKLRIKNSELFSKTEVAAPGFINFWLSEKILQDELKEILKNKENYGSLNLGENKKVSIEFISANPTGQLTIGNGRGGFLGDVLARILEFGGYKVSREYYINNAKTSTQIKELGKTVLGQGQSYLTEDLKSKILKFKNKIKNLKNKKIGNSEGETGYLLANEIQKENQKFIVKDLKIKFDRWFNEEDLYQSGAVKKLLEDLKKKKLVYEKEGALWFKTKNFGDSEDRVLVRTPRLAGQAGEPTYFLPDLAYHLNKIKIRKFDEAIDIWGADHHGYLPRLKAGLKALGISEDKLKAIITQLVRLKKGGEEVKMSKRTGEFITLKDLVEEAGLDAVRFFFLMSSPDTHMDFDLDLAKEQSLKNPVYYVQYAAVRCGSILKKSQSASPDRAGRRRIKPQTKIKFDLLTTPEDINLMRMLARFPEIVEAAVENYNPQVLVRFALDLARGFHNFYEKERIIGEENDLMSARLELLRATQIIFRNIFGILGLNFLNKM